MHGHTAAQRFRDFGRSLTNDEEEHLRKRMSSVKDCRLLGMQCVGLQHLTVEALSIDYPEPEVKWGGSLTIMQAMKNKHGGRLTCVAWIVMELVWHN